MISSHCFTTAANDGAAPLAEDVSINAFADCITVAQYDAVQDKVHKSTLSPSQLRDLEAALDLPEGLYQPRKSPT